MTTSLCTISSRIGFALTRIIVPLWVLAGASFKLYERDEANLPSGIRAIAQDLQIDLAFLLRLLIGLEFFAIGVMFFMPRLARAMAIFMLSCFCLILLNELRRQATKCGCFGSLPIKPWQMLLVDGSLLLSVLFFRPAKSTVVGDKARSLLLPTMIATVGLAVLGLTLSFAVPKRPSTPQVPATEPTPSPTTTQPSVVIQPGPTATKPDVAPPAVQTPPVAATGPGQPNPNPQPLPNSWYVSPSTDAWIGKPWREIDLFQLMPRWPSNMDKGKHYVVFYKRDCDHCKAMFYEHLLIELDAPITAVQIPFSKTQLMPPEEDTWQMPPTPAELLALPLGCSWVVTPPMAITVVDGVVKCAAEGEHWKPCLGLPEMPE